MFFLAPEKPLTIYANRYLPHIGIVPLGSKAKTRWPSPDRQAVFMTDTGRTDNMSSLDRFMLAAGQLGIEITDQTLRLFLSYEQELLRWNEKINLVSLRSRDELWMKHFLDSISVAPLIVNSSGRLLDIGSGGGFPGLPLAIVMPDLQIHLVEASRKKSSFLKQVIRVLKLPRAQVLNERIEKLQEDVGLRDYFDTVTSRAAFKLADLVRYGTCFLSPGGNLISLKGSRALGEELRDALELGRTTGLFFLPDPIHRADPSGQKRFLLVFKKMTPVSRTDFK